MEKIPAFKTKFFKEGGSLSTEFKDDFSTFLETPKEVLDEINKIFKLKDIHLKGRGETISIISEASSYDPEKISNVISVITFLTGILEKRKLIDDLLSDLVLKEYLPEINKKKAKEKIEYVYSFIEETINRKEKARVEGWGAPEYFGGSASADLRLYPKESYNWSKDIEKYTPEVKSLIPMGLIELNIKKHSGEESFSFQVNLDEVRILKNLFISLEKELNLLNEIAKKHKQGRE